MDPSTVTSDPAKHGLNIVNQRDDTNTLSGPPSVAGDESIHAELAKANLMRLRGEYISAEQQCIAILQTSPENPTVSSLLGDIAAEQGKLEASVQWYEMALDAGAGPGIAEKVHGIRQRIYDRDTAGASSEPPLPSASLLTPGNMIAAAVVILILIIGAFAAGSRGKSGAVAAKDEAPIVVPADGKSSTDAPTTGTISTGTGTADSVNADPSASSAGKTPQPTTSSSAGLAPATSAPGGSSPPAGPAIDPDLLPLIQGASGPLATVTGAVSDPRTNSVTLTAPLAEGSEASEQALVLVLAAHAKMKATDKWTVRFTQQGKVVYEADAARDKLDAAETSAPSTKVLTNVWRPTDAPQSG